MNTLTRALALAAVAVGVAANPAKTDAQVDINVGAEPVCAYGYYDYPPYACAPYGYYGPEWFSGGVFIGGGPRFRGHEDFNDHLDNRFDVHRGDGRALTDRGDNHDPARGFDQSDHFGGNGMRDGRGHEGGRR